MRRRGGLNKIGILAIAMIIALGAVGVSYSAWVDTVTITGSLSTSPVDDGLACGTCSPDSGVSYITCASVISEPTKIYIMVINAQLDIDYCCKFTFSNDVDSWPVEIMGTSLSNPYSDLGVSAVSNDLTGMVIAPGTSVTGEVHIYLADNTEINQNLIFTLDVTVYE
jgi:hypothetical protein